MLQKYFICLIMVACVILAPATIKSQEFPIAVGNDTTFSGGAVYGVGEKGIVAIQGDATNPYSINAQLIAYPGTLVEQRISLGDVGVWPGAIPIFDGTNYFLVWCDTNGVLKGYLINTAGELVGSSFTIANGVSTEELGITYGDNSSLVVFDKTDEYLFGHYYGYLYGQIVDKSGNLIGNQIQISSNFAREVAVAYDGTNYLVAWVEQIPDYSDKNIYGQFVSNSGSLIGNNFIIDDGPYYSDNPISLAYDGTRYLLAFHETTNSSNDSTNVDPIKWTLLGRFITTTGTIQETITICDSLLLPFLPYIAFDGSNYFITWTQFSNGSLMGRFFNTSGVPITEPSVIFGPSDNKIPVGGVGFGGGYYLAIATKVDSTFSDGDVYGRFIDPITGVEEEKSKIPKTYVLYQNYPNPFNPRTKIKYSIPSSKNVEIKIFDVLGNEIINLVNEYKPAGTYEIEFDANNLSSGIYFYRIISGKYFETKKMLLMK